MVRAAIICVDDEEIILSSLGEQLKRSFGKDYDIEVATNGSEAISIFAELTVEGIEIPLIISDQMMPEMSGDQLLIKLHSLYPKTLKILLTGQAHADSVGNLVNAAALYRYISKPWNETDLILTVKEALLRHNQEQTISDQNQLLKQINQNLAKSLSLLEATLEATADGILVMDELGKVVRFNQKFIDLWEIPKSIVATEDKKELVTITLEQLVEPYVCDLQDQHIELNCRNYKILELKNGKILESYWQPQQLQEKIVGLVWSFRDITQHKRAEAIIKHQALHDKLTNLPNRNYFDKQLSLALANARESQKLLAVMFFDLDRFKVVNDTLGHAIGDLLLQKVVERLTDCIRGTDLMARWGGDEFTLLLPEISCREDATAIAQRILETLKPPFLLEEHRLHVTSSIGIAIYPDDGEDAETLLKNADSALYRVKERGRNDYQHYTFIINSQALKLLALENSLYSAIEREEFILYYQPQVNATTNAIVGMEALLRWQHPEFGLVPPNVFIPLAEQNGAIAPMGEWILKTACSQNKIWQEMGFPSLCVAVNLSVRQFKDRHLVETVGRILKQTQLPPNCLEIEITETVAMQNTDLAKTILMDLHEMGVYLSMDDFGTGYSSLNYLKQFPFHTLKIDQSFIKDLKVNLTDTAIIKAIIALGKGLNLKVVAEGVETLELKNLLQTLECEYMQGYFFSRPLSPQDATTLLKSHFSHHRLIVDC
jgi:diguanylate cyclase (GGDEF)-like protein/PAS domain S-box-containing protein